MTVHMLTLDFLAHKCLTYTFIFARSPKPLKSFATELSVSLCTLSLSLYANEVVITNPF